MRRPRFRESTSVVVRELWSEGQMELRKGEVRRLEGDPRGLSVMCTQGILWITQEGNLADTILEADQRYVIARRGSVVIGACSDARLRIAPPFERARARSRSDSVTTRRD